MSLRRRPRASADVNSGWAVFNLETDSETLEFDFTVALGASRATLWNPRDRADMPRRALRSRTDRMLSDMLRSITEESDEESIPSSDTPAHAQCMVWISPPARKSHRSSGWAHLRPRRLEILGPDRQGKEYDCEGQGERQLLLALRLFRAMPLWAVPWGRREEVFVLAKDYERYRFTRDELGRFLAFSKRLFDFHVHRNLYHLARAVPADKEFWKHAPRWLGERLDDESLGRVVRPMVAIDLFEEAGRDWRLSNELRLILLVMAAEALFSDDDRGELAYRLSTRMAGLHGDTSSERRRCFERAREAYNLRSRLLHGGIYKRKGEFLTVSSAKVQEFRDLVRASLCYFMAIAKKKSREQILEILDGALFDDEQIRELRGMARDFWGLGDSQKGTSVLQVS